MDVVRLGNRNDFILEDGQSTVEYMLLVAVIVAIMTTVFNSAAFRDLIGENGQFAQAIKNETEWNYRHGLAGRQTGNIVINYPGGLHPTYWNSSKSTTHFFAPVNPYPR